MKIIDDIPHFTHESGSTFGQKQATSADLSELQVPTGRLAGLSTILGCSALSLLPSCRTLPQDNILDRAAVASNSIISAPTDTSLHESRIGQAASSLQARGKDPQDPRPEYAHLTSTDDGNPTHFWYTNRDNIVGETAVDEWDPLKLINTDRPDFTDVAAVVGDGRVQIETGFLRIDRHEGEEQSRVETAPNALVRVGMGDSFEWRLKSRGYTHAEISNSTGERGDIEGLSDAELGFKWVMTEQEDLAPMQSIVVRVGVPTGSEDLSSHRVEPGLSYIYNWQVRRWWFFRGSTGIDGFNQPTFSLKPSGGGIESSHDDWIELSQSVSSYFQISKQVGSFVEWFMLQRTASADNTTEHFHNYGLYLYVTPDVQLDCRVGWRFGDSADDMFWGAGVSVRL